jgi:hypothetical protein
MGRKDEGAGEDGAWREKENGKKGLRRFEARGCKADTV